MTTPPDTNPLQRALDQMLDETRALIRRTQEARGMPVTEVDLATVKLITHVREQLEDEFLTTLEATQALIHGPAKPAPNQPQCRHCGLPIVKVNDRWTHFDNAGSKSVGCRAASWSPGNGWNDMDKSKKATPERGER